ncbi:MAG: hypothetical protein FWC58_09825 [Desulfobulbus sp.]|nr:hypothetical protein [Desulfobulbus sp.]
MNKHPLLIVAVVLSLVGCDQVNEKLGFESAAKKAAQAEADAKAVGGACRQSGRAIEDCYAIYAWLPKAGVYAGWREMDEYMRENKIDTITPQLPPVEAPGKKRRPPPAAEGEATTNNGSEAAADKNGGKK